MSFWTWFKSDGDKLCNFVTLASLALQTQPSIPRGVLAWMTVGGVLATAAHQSFFTSSTPDAPVQEISK